MFITAIEKNVFPGFVDVKGLGIRDLFICSGEKKKASILIYLAENGSVLFLILLLNSFIK